MAMGVAADGTDVYHTGCRCVPMLGFVTTRPVAAGEELLVTYGHGYWLQRVTEVSEAVDFAVRG